MPTVSLSRSIADGRPRRCRWWRSWLAATPNGGTGRARARRPSRYGHARPPRSSDSTPWIAAAGSFVAVAWGASADGKADVFVAVSRDGGGTFGAPVRVNLVPGEGRLGGELPPRVADASGQGTAVPDVVVLWDARGTSTEIKTARSRDGGATFEKPSTLQSAGAGGRSRVAGAGPRRAGRRARHLARPSGLAARPSAAGARQRRSSRRATPPPAPRRAR